MVALPYYSTLTCLSKTVYPLLSYLAIALRSSRFVDKGIEICLGMLIAKELPASSAMAIRSSSPRVANSVRMVRSYPSP